MNAGENVAAATTERRPRRLIWIGVGLALVVGAAIAGMLIYFGGEDGPQYTDEQLAREFSSKVYSKDLDQAAAGPEAATKEIVESMEAECVVLRSGLVTTEPSSSNDLYFEQYEVRMAGIGSLTARQTRDMLTIAAKYRCPEFSTAIAVYDATN